MKVKEMKIGNCTVEFHDEYRVQTEEDRQAILKRLSIMVSNNIAKRIKKQTA